MNGKLTYVTPIFKKVSKLVGCNKLMEIEVQDNMEKKYTK